MTRREMLFYEILNAGALAKQASLRLQDYMKDLRGKRTLAQLSD
jgi:hypothetical protein